MIEEKETNKESFPYIRLDSENVVRRNPKQCAKHWTTNQIRENENTAKKKKISD